MPDNILSRSISCSTFLGSQPRSVDLSKQDSANLLIRSNSTGILDRSGTFQYNSDKLLPDSRTPSEDFFTPCSSLSSFQFELDDVPSARDILEGQLNELVSIVSKQIDPNSQDENPFCIPIETDPSPAIYTFLEVFIDDCLEKNNTDDLINQYKGDLKILLKDFRIFKEDTAIEILSHLLKKSLFKFE